GATPPLNEQGMEAVNAGALRERGVVFSEGVADDMEIRLVALQNPEEVSWWIGLHNFGVINRYNRSPLYAMAVVDLTRAVRKIRAGN
ncbi:MAG TPA: lytic murein transglycosylase, partial [Gammaproteobacteria bacterium]